VEKAVFVSDSWRFRNGTLDRAIFNGVAVFNEYCLPASFAHDAIVVDVGAHIGSFAHAVVARGCKNVYCIEPDRSNIAIAAENLRPHVEAGAVRLVRGAAWRSDRNTDELCFSGYRGFPASYAGMEGIVNTGNGSVMWGNGEPVAKLAFDDIVDLVTTQGENRVRLLKLDCEGAEWPILLTSQRLDLIDEICGEFHEIGGPFLEIGEDSDTRNLAFSLPSSARFTIDTLVGFLEGAGFAVAYRRHRRPTGALEGLGLFFARREPAESVVTGNP
jgi:FkbM family methyltransferase